MCRYAWHNYRDHFACFHCRKTFKYWQWEPIDELTFIQKQNLQHVPREMVCPDCKKPMTDMGLDFRAPRRTDLEAWQVMSELANNGFTFHSCGCFVGFTPPKTLREVPQWIADHRQKSKGEMLLDKFNRKMTAKKQNRSR